MTVEGIWKYVEGDLVKTKHAFKTTKAELSLCGRIPTWYGSQWKTDKKGLSKLRECRRCLNSLKIIVDSELGV